jgi:hypothetical protein
VGVALTPGPVQPARAGDEAGRDHGGHPLRDECHRLLRTLQLGSVGYEQQRPEVDVILRSSLVTGQQLQRDQVTSRRNGHMDPRKYLQCRCGAHDLRLDPRGGEQQIHHRSDRCLRPATEPHRGQTLQAVVLKPLDDLERRHQACRELLGRHIIGDGHGEVDVAGEPGLGPDGDRQSPDQRERRPLAVEGRDNLTEQDRQRRHRGC